MEDTATVEGVNLQLNGFGTRYKGPFKVYVGELYTTKKVGSLEELISAPGPKRLSMVFVREIEAGPFGKLLTRGVEDNNSKAEMSKLVPGLIRMGDIFTVNKVLVPGDVIHLDWIPGTGMVITAKGKVQGEPFKEPEFSAPSCPSGLAMCRPITTSRMPCWGLSKHVAGQPVLAATGALRRPLHFSETNSGIPARLAISGTRSLRDTRQGTCSWICSSPWHLPPPWVCCSWEACSESRD
ncbi:MAG: chalcone isomerase family protein [Rhodoferax sp.]